MHTNYYIAIKAALDAGNEILKIYHSDNFNVEFKADESPLTQADKNAHLKIMEYLEQTNIPILSEEGKHLPYSERKNRTQFWLVDPLDGTKEFIKRNGEFTVNIALIKNEKPVFGVIYVPVTEVLYFGDTENGAFKISDIKTVNEGDNYQILQSKAQKLPAELKHDVYQVVGSRSHQTPETKAFFEQLETKYQKINIISVGSSLKLCMVAEGKADIYPRFGPTMEWDTGAGHAIALASGAKIYRADTKEELLYNKENLLNPYFIVER